MARLQTFLDKLRGTLTLAAAPSDTDYGLRIGYQHEIYPRLKIIPSGVILTGDGSVEPATAPYDGTYVPRPAVAPTVGQILSATDDDPLTTDWIDAPAGEVTQQELDDVNDNLTTLITGKQAAITQQTSAPGSPSTGDLWIDTDGPGLVVAEAHADAGSASSSAEQTLASFTLPGGLIVVGDVLRFTAMGDLLNNSGGAVTYTWRFKIGTTTVLVTSALSIGTNANRLTWKVDADIHFPTTATERVCAQILATGQGTAQWKTLAIAATVSAVGYGTASEDTATDKAVALTCQMNTSNASADVILHAAALTHLHA